MGVSSWLCRVRTFVLLALALVFVGTWPGAAVHAVTLELTAPSIPKEIAAREGILDVVVTDADGSPLAGAKVRGFAILGPERRAYDAGEAESDRAGRATLSNLPTNAEHWIVADAAGHARASQMVVVVSGPRRVDLQLGPEHAIDVEVKDEKGAPMIAEIEVRGTDPFPVGARTGSDGRVHVGRLGDGPYTVVARAPGYEEVTKRRAPERELVSFVLGKQGALAIEVVGEDDAPAAGARVLVASPTLGSVRVAETAKDGKVRITGLDRGSYSLRAVQGSRASAIEIGLVLGKSEEKTLRLKLEPGLLVAVHVVSATDDEDVKDAHVTLTEGGISPFPLEGVTDKHGHVTLGPIARGLATLAARAEGFVPKSVVPVEASGETKVALARGGILVGKVTDGRGYAVDGATIRIVGTDLEGMPIDEDPSRIQFRESMFDAQLGGPSPLKPAGELGVTSGPVPAIPHGEPVSVTVAPGARAQALVASPTAEPWVSGRDGTFRATPVTPGRVRAIVSHPQYVEALSEVVLVESDKESRVDVVLQRGGNLEGRVVDARGRTVANAHVTAMATHGSLEHFARTGTDGSFAFAALPDAITLLVSRDEDPTTILARLEVTVPEAGKKSVEITLPEPRPALPVKVTDHRGSGIEGAQVSAVSLDPSATLRATAFTDGRGNAELAGAKGIAVRVEVHAPGRAAQIVTTTPETPELVVKLVQAESLTGSVTTRRRDPITNADVTLQTSAGVQHAHTSGDGTFTFGDLAVGQARLRVRAPGHAPDDRTVTIEDRGGRKPTEVPRFELAEEGVVEGVVVDGRGDPIPGARVAKDAVPTYLPVGAAAVGMAVADGRGRFHLGELAEGTIVLEAYAADVGRTRKSDVRVLAGRTASDVKLVITRGEAGPKEPLATGGVAITLGETMAGLEDAEVIVLAVSEGSEAERGGLAVNDIVVEIGGTKVASVNDARARLSGPVHDDVLVKVRRGEQLVPLRIAREAVRR